MVTVQLKNQLTKVIRSITPVRDDSGAEMVDEFIEQLFFSLT